MLLRLGAEARPACMGHAPSKGSQFTHSQCHTFTKPQVGLSLGVVGVSVDGSGQYGAAASLDSYVTVWNMGDYSTGGCCCICLAGAASVSW